VLEYQREPSPKTSPQTAAELDHLGDFLKGCKGNERRGRSTEFEQSRGNKRNHYMTKGEIAYLLLRLTLGANIFLHGFSRLIGDHAAFAAYMDKQMHNAPLPGFLVHFVGVVLPWCEGTVGLLMILGLWTSVALIAGSLLMLALQIGTCLAQN
jgi:uncharacterized membrane protein YphA (DoxX/SURF4 family)